MTEIIPPAAAARPDEACQLVCDALSDGDLDAAVTYYHPLAVIAPPDGPPVRGEVAIRELLRQAAATRMLYQVQAEQALLADDTALVTGHWTVLGPGAAADGNAIGSGRFCSVLRRQPDGTWQILAEQMTHRDSPAVPLHPAGHVSKLR